MVAAFKANDQMTKMKELLAFPLISHQRVRHFVDTVEALSQYMYKFYFDTYVDKKKTDREDSLDSKKNAFQSKQDREAISAQAEAFDRFFTFFPFWDTRFCEGSKEDAVFLRRQLQINVPDSYNLSQVLKCETLREVVLFYQVNRESQNIAAFTQDEMLRLEQRGLERSKAEFVRNLIAFLSKQARNVPEQFFDFLDAEKKKFKIDLRGMRLGRVAGIAAVCAAALNLRHPISRIDISDFECDEDVGSTVTLFIKNKKVSIRELQVNGNKLEVAGFGALYKSTMKLDIEVFAINSCQTSLESNVLIPTFVQGATKLRILSLENNNLQDNIGSLVLKYATNSKTLKYLNLNNNNLADQSVEAMRTLISKNNSLECLEFENNVINEHLLEPLKLAFKECRTSSLIAVKIGSIKKTATDHSLDFRKCFSYLSKLSLGTITFTTDLKDQEMSLTTILQENRSLYIINYLAPGQKNPLQSTALTFFTEHCLLQRSSMDELIDCYAKSIQSCEMKYDIVLDKNIHNLWPKFQQQKAQEKLTLDRLKNDSPEKLLARYLVSLVFDKFRGISQLELVYLTLKYLISMNTCFEDGFNLLHKIIMSGNSTLLEECFKIGLSLNVNTFEANRQLPVVTSLQLILLTRNREMLLRMLAYKPNVDERDEYGNTLLHYACLYGEVDTAKRLIELQCEADAQNALGMNSLHTSIMGNNIECFLVVLTAMGRATIDDDHVIKQIRSNKQNCLHLSVIYRCQSVFEYSLEVLENLDVQDHRGKTALMYAVESGNKEFADKLIAAKANLMLFDSSGNNLLFYILAKRDVETFEVRSTHARKSSRTTRTKSRSTRTETSKICSTLPRSSTCPASSCTSSTKASGPTRRTASASARKT